MNAPLFPRDTTHWQTVELSTWRALTLSTVEIGVLTGFLVRAFRALAMSHGAGPDGSPGALYLGATFGIGVIVLCGMLTLHLANFPVRRWPWRVLAFALVESAAEMVASAVLIAAGREPLGTTGRAHWDDLPSLAVRTVIVRVLVFAVFAAVLAAVVQLVRRTLARRGPHHLHPTHSAPREP
jgi:cytochrome bd-type quinol oxidase subunit 1